MLVFHLINGELLKVNDDCLLFLDDKDPFLVSGFELDQWFTFNGIISLADGNIRYCLKPESIVYVMWQEKSNATVVSKSPLGI